MSAKIDDIKVLRCDNRECRETPADFGNKKSPKDTLTKNNWKVYLNAERGPTRDLFQHLTSIAFTIHSMSLSRS